MNSTDMSKNVSEQIFNIIGNYRHAVAKQLSIKFNFDVNEATKFLAEDAIFTPTPVSGNNTKPPKVKKNTILIIEEDDKCEVKKNNDICEYIEQIDINFKKCVKGYHLINSSSINETIWEDINAIIFSSSGIDIYSKSDGSHSSGMDINSSLGRISNKSAKYANNKKSIDISSYRLTTVCSEKKCGTPAEII